MKLFKLIFETKKDLAITVICIILGLAIGTAIYMLNDMNTRMLIERYSQECNCICMMEVD